MNEKWRGYCSCGSKSEDNTVYFVHYKTNDNYYKIIGKHRLIERLNTSGHKIDEVYSAKMTKMKIETVTTYEIID